MKSWKTSLAGVAALCTALGTILKAWAAGGPAALATIDWTATIASISAGLGLLAARDNNVTSEQALAKNN